MDVVGYYTAGTPGPGGFNGLSPARLLDTRNTGPCISSTRDLTVAGVGGVAANASSVVLNVTVTGPTAAGFVTVYPTGVSAPTASNLNYTKNQTVPNAVTVKVGTGGKVSILASSGCPQVIVDVVGYFGGGGVAGIGGFTGITPARSTPATSGPAPASKATPTSTAPAATAFRPTRRPSCST